MWIPALKKLDEYNTIKRTSAQEKVRILDLRSKAKFEARSYDRAGNDFKKKGRR